MENPYSVMNKIIETLKKAINENAREVRFHGDEILVLNKALEYGTAEWWETLKDKKGDTNN